MKKSELKMRLYQRQENGYRDIFVDIQSCRLEYPYDFQTKNFGSFERSVNDAELMIRASKENDQSKFCYNYKILTSHLYNPDFNDIENAYKIMKKINSELDKMSEVRGNIENFESYVLRVAEILKIGIFEYTERGETRITESPKYFGEQINNILAE